MSFTIDMSGKVVLVTGGSRGVGDGIVETFLRAGAELEICGRRAPGSLREVDGRRPHFSPVDVRDAAAVQAWVAEIAERRGRLDIAVNNAGGSPYAPLATSSAQLYGKIAQLNFMAAVHVAHAVHPLLAYAGEGVLLNITSISARRPSPGTAVYGAAKAALESLTGSLAVEWAPRIRVNAVRCGIVATPGSMDHYGDAEQVAKVAATIPRGVFATPAEVGAACLLLASPLASHVTGAVLNVDGGGEWPAFLQHTPNG
ncbi:NAD(P)-dependent dehydrogenase, short-chain alcohol dehydrogenase family [Parafrankia irregularis]|uniref:NAD(P)-dependent dehydrogenase, short-chain alcohol dehydrogenase family n=1 Tax=Parafrankia irregularis TaxID=795642 RepID=A0A0S4QP86_9ACTN|nr:MULTISPECIES: SDR family oxidoreductase [Parafrankia]MBE3200086.1 SDR family oxidoreductase [Parafrankia sp. CH37]CUU56728.1 NAD(P)-dependent dehydrogenase, short-chain alcohol dehydrogenase family [Parafrankia irregularis]